MNATFAENFKKHPHYTAFLQIEKKLHKHNFVCWLAGGAVRDLLLNRHVHDFDLVTDADFETLKKIFPEAILVGASFGVLKIPVVINQGEVIQLDLAIFRKDYEYQDGRRPSKVLIGSPEEDAMRRDFTMNALYWDHLNQKIVDYVGGLPDLKLKQIKCVGNSDERFLEDHLRILRLLRFHIQLNFQMNEKTLMAALESVPLLKKISGERIWDEFKKIALANNYSLINDNELGPKIFEEVFQTKFHKTSVNDYFSGQDELIIFYNWIFASTSLDVMNTEIIKQILQKRLRISKKELSLFSRVLWFKMFSSKLSAEEIFMEIEKDSELKSIFQFFHKSSQVDNDKFQKIESLMTTDLAPLVQANDLKAWMPAQKITKALYEARLRQLQGLISNKEEGIQHLRQWLLV